MIRTVAELLEKLLSHERKKLDEYQIAHGPTIGRMYEGLAADILGRTIPPQFNLRVVSGFIFNDRGELTGEIDCMLVAGEGLPIPYTTSFKWNIRDVVAVFEIKKTLYGAEISDAFKHLSSILSVHSQQLEEAPDETLKLPFVRRAFAEITRKIPPSLSKIEGLPFHEELILHALIVEHASPVRVVFGYHGYRSEFSFREGMVAIIEKSIGEKGFGVGSFPQLMVSGDYSLLKANGRPYSAPMTSEFWDFYLSSSTNPLLLLIELIWTRLEERFEIGMPWGEDLHIEALNVFLSARGTPAGWEYRYTPLTNDQLTANKLAASWKPVFLSLPQFLAVNWLCQVEVINTLSDEFAALASRHGLSVDSFVESLLATGLIAIHDNRMELITEKCDCAILPTGQYVAAENNTGRLTRWIANRSWTSNEDRAADGT